MRYQQKGTSCIGIIFLYGGGPISCPGHALPSHRKKSPTASALRRVGSRCSSQSARYTSRAMITMCTTRLPFQSPVVLQHPSGLEWDSPPEGQNGVNKKQEAWAGYSPRCTAARCTDTCSIAGIPVAAGGRQVWLLGGGRTSDLQVEWMETLGWEAVDSTNKQ